MYDHGNHETQRRLQRTVAALCDPTSYAEETGRIEAIETHMAWVFLTDEHAYKLKKPIRTPFMDYTTKEKRRRGCQREVELNRRLAPDVYLGVSSVVETDGQFRVDAQGAPRDWLIKMKRLPRQRMLDARIESREVLPKHVDAVTELLCSFYDRADKAGLNGPQYRDRIVRDIESKAESLDKHHYGLNSAHLHDAVHRLNHWAEANGTLLATRADRVVDAHGDLRPEHVCLIDDPVVIDCLEFSRELRLLDPLSELSFLALECRRLGASWIGERLLKGYAERTGDHPPPTLVWFYTGYHALIRAAIALWHLDDATLDDDDKWPRRARWYLDVIRGESAFTAAR